MGVERVLVSDYPPKQILDKIEKIEEQLIRIEKKLDDHINFIMKVYKPLSKPIDKFREWLR